MVKCMLNMLFCIVREIKGNMFKEQEEKIDPKLLRMTVIMLFGMIAPSLDATIVNIAIGTIIVEFNSSISVVQWITTAYILVMGIAVPLSAWLVNRLSGKTVYLTSLVIFFIGSVFAAFSRNIEFLIFSRILQGIGAGILIPTLSTVLVRRTGNTKLGHLMAIVSIPALIIPILGPVLGGLIVNKLPWQWIFYINIPICVIAVILAVKYLDKDEPVNRKQPLDVLGTLLLSSFFSILIIGISKLRTGGLENISVIIPLLAGLALLLAYIVYALNAKIEPVLNVHLFKISNFSSSSVLMLVSGGILTGTSFILPLFYQQVQNSSALTAGLLLAPQGIGMLCTRGISGKLTDKIGSRIIVLVAIIITIIGTIPFVFANSATSKILLALALFIRGCGLGGVSIPIMVSIYEGLTKEQAAHGTTATRIFQQIGASAGTAVLAIILQNHIPADADIQAVGKAFNTVFMWSIGFAVLSIIPALFLPIKKG
jgi:EmrB/QacA subfamily drug resistance transporter